MRPWRSHDHLRHAPRRPGSENSEARDLLEAGSVIHTVREPRCHKNVATAMIYTRVLNRGPPGVQSPADRPLGG